MTRPRTDSADDLAGLLNVPREFEHAGQTYSVGTSFTPDQIALYTQWLTDRAFAAAAAQEGKLPPHLFERQLEATVAAAAAGRFGWKTPASVESLFTPDGAAYALYLLLKDDHPEVDEIAAKEMVLKRLDDEVARIIAEVASGPKSSATGESLSTGTPSSPGSGTNTGEASQKSESSPNGRSPGSSSGAGTTAAGST